ncbi:MAG TPA: sialate O-acetylesterase [Lachnoclostridium sp.]|uniref:sialate O-acetylesterase n=1 Tax=Lacrimispora sp. TaxID=2719234 RepID=UPI000ECD4230|nr:sialate O-acetylesterase [Lacrimispora sp.]HCD42947.1 sialate O-acetylesterase [Lachnoclostridium sp.]
MSSLNVTPYISDHAVLQRNEFIPIRGTADGGGRVEAILSNEAGGVEFREEALTEEDGNWKLVFMPMQAGGPYSISITCAGERKEFSDIYIGDVWLMSGQSNMQLPMNRVKYRFPREYREDGDPLIRQFTVPIKWDFKAPADELSGGKWESYSLDCASYFSAAGYFFGAKLRERYSVPIGLILTAVGGTPIEAWMSRKALTVFSGKAKTADECKSDEYVRGIQKEDEERTLSWYKKLDEDDRGILEDCLNTDLQDLWKTVSLTDDFYINEDFEKPGSVWFKKTVTIPPELSGKPLRLSLGTIKDADDTYVDGQCIGNITYRYPPREYHLEGLAEGDHEIMIRVIAVSGRIVFTKGKSHQMIFETGETLSISEGWKYKRSASLEALTPPTFFERKPMGMYQSMIAPLHDFPICGMCWYQGESNADDDRSYPQYFKRMIEDYRRKWHMGKFPVIYVQLPNYDLEDAGNWVRFRNMQQSLAKLPNCAMVVTIDCGEYNDLHPTDKKTVGERMAMAAFKIAYHEPGEWLSPIFSRAERNGDEIILYFDHGEKGFSVSGGETGGFEVCISERWISDRIEVRTQGGTVILSAQKREAITGVRYAWSNNPENANLRSASGLPVTPFETVIV